MTWSRGFTALKSQMGSQGKVREPRTNGGGRIVIASDSVVLGGTGAIKANGLPLEEDSLANDYLPGGSGGYVFVVTENNINDN